ncbi:MAG TPA: hypothetical protein PKB07_15890 [Flavilitoribacter sp.]|nr:hypothetical protein [Flavilitoribacter sp.]
MEIKVYKKEIEQLIQKGDNIEQALKRLLEILNKKSQFRKEIIGLSGRAESLKKDARKQIIDRTTANQEKNQIRDAVLEIKNSLKKEDLKKDLELKEGIYEKILIYCPESRKPFFQKNINTQYFKNIYYFVDLDEPKPDLDTFDIVLFDFDEKEQLGEDRLEELLLATKTYFLVLIYGQSNLIRKEEYRDRVQAANSAISLIARLQELITYFRFAREK